MSSEETLRPQGKSLLRYVLSAFDTPVELVVLEGKPETAGEDVHQRMYARGWRWMGSNGYDILGMLKRTQFIDGSKILDSPVEQISLETIEKMAYGNSTTTDRFTYNRISVRLPWTIARELLDVPLPPDVPF